MRSAQICAVSTNCLPLAALPPVSCALNPILIGSAAVAGTVVAKSTAAVIIFFRRMSRSRGKAVVNAKDAKGCAKDAKRLFLGAKRRQNSLDGFDALRAAHSAFASFAPTLRPLRYLKPFK